VLGWRHTNPLFRQGVYYVQSKFKVERQFSGTGGISDNFFLNINMKGKTTVLHLAHFCSSDCVSSNMQFIGHN
jgi:hypothetical protein